MQTPRFSIGYFVWPRDDYVIQGPKKVYPAITMAEFMKVKHLHPTTKPPTEMDAAVCMDTAVRKSCWVSPHRKLGREGEANNISTCAGMLHRYCHGTLGSSAAYCACAGQGEAVRRGLQRGPQGIRGPLRHRHGRSKDGHCRHAAHCYRSVLKSGWSYEELKWNLGTNTWQMASRHLFCGRCIIGASAPVVHEGLLRTI